jgi:hypothetical protein
LETYDLDDSRGSNDKTVSDAVALRRFQEDLVEVLKELTRKYRLEDDISLNEIARIVGEKAKSSRKLSEFLGVYTRQRNGWQVLLETARGVFAFALTEKSPLFGALSDSNPRSLKDIPVWKSEFAAPDVRGGTDAISPKNRNEDEDQDQDQDQDMDFEEQRTPYLHIWQVLLEARDGGTPVSESRVRKELKLLGSDVSVRAVIQTLMQLYIYGKKPVIEKVTGGYQITQAAWDDIDKVDAEIRDRIGDLIF